MSATERVAAACPGSKFKDDRHDWILVMHEQGLCLPLSSSPYPKAYYALRRCIECKLTVLLAETEGDYKAAPRRDDSIIYAFYPNGPL